MPDMNTALHAQERNDVTSCWYGQQSTADKKRLKEWLHFSKCDANDTHCNICDSMCEASSRNTYNLRKLLQRFPTGIRGRRHPPEDHGAIWPLQLIDGFAATT
ncbi:hypothetical protein ILYODFUR_019172 [Ilyodon furcidens]|uniref:Uncharacterized protein n=1 Tax=Ilyodon furcidens TaxID=33524 RepID=A0ABV0UW74_9TELE